MAASRHVKDRSKKIFDIIFSPFMNLTLEIVFRELMIVLKVTESGVEIAATRFIKQVSSYALMLGSGRH